MCLKVLWNHKTKWTHYCRESTKQEWSLKKAQADEDSRRQSGALTGRIGKEMEKQQTGHGELHLPGTDTETGAVPSLIVTVKHYHVIKKMIETVWLENGGNKLKMCLLLLPFMWEGNKSSLGSLGCRRFIKNKLFINSYMKHFFSPT